jgi:hypothetical protein
MNKTNSIINPELYDKIIQKQMKKKRIKFDKEFKNLKPLSIRDKFMKHLRVSLLRMIGFGLLLVSIKVGVVVLLISEVVSFYERLAN